MTRFAEWLWSTDVFTNLWANPLDVIIGLYISPCSPQELSEATEIKLAGKASGSYSSKVLNNYSTLDFGYLELSEFYGNFVDYKTTTQIYIPYVGVKTVDINNFMTGRIYLRYIVDFSTGTAVAFISSLRGNLNGVIYQYECNIFSQIPLTYQSANSIAQTIITAGIGALSAPTPTALATGLASSATNAIFQQPQIENSGRLTTNAGFISVQQPYLIIQRPMPSNAAGFKSDRGYMSNVTARLGDLNGYTEVYYCNLSGISCTEEERERLMNLLKTGVYL